MSFSQNISDPLHNLCSIKLCSKLYERIPNRRDSDYFDSYQNPDWEPTPFYQKLMYRCLYFLSGPKFLVPFIGSRSETSRQTSYQHTVYFFPKHSLLFERWTGCFTIAFVLTMKFKICNEVSSLSMFRE